MAITGSYKIDNADFEELQRMLKKKLVARVGILSGSKPRDDGFDNGEIGITQELGSIVNNIPARSFLKMPIERNHKKIEEKLVASKEAKKAFAAGDIVKLLKILGVIAEGFVHEAFETSGFGTWAPNAPATIAKKKSAMPLIDKRELSRAILSDVAKP